MSAIPILLRQMHERWTAALDEWTVTYGWDDTQNTGDYLMIGADDPFRSEGEAATSSSDFVTATREGIDEEGQITVCAYSWNGEHDGQQAATDAVFAALAVIENDLHLNPELGVARTPHFAVEALNVEELRLHHGMDADGAQALLVIRIGFKAYRRADLS